MALTTSYSTGAVSASATTIVLAAFTNPSASGRPKTILRFTTGEYCLITSNVGTALQVVRGYLGSMAVAHSALEGVQYGLTSDTEWPPAAATVIQAGVAPVTITNAQHVTITGSTGTDAAIVTAPWPAILTCSGASGAGLNLPIPLVGAQYVVRNSASGAVSIYCVGGSINGTTGTTAVSLTSTGVDGSIFWCSTAGAWVGAPNSV